MKAILLKIKSLFVKNENKILFSILGILGFSSACKNILPVAEYGVPVAEYILQGKITSAENTNPVKGIQVIMANEYRYNDTAYTDSDGNYCTSSVDYPENLTFQIFVNDVDSTLNGSYQNQTLSVTFSSDDLSGGDGNWDSGSATKILNIVINPK